MSAGESTAEKSEPPTEKKIRDARKKGQVAKSTDVSTTGLLLVVFAFFTVLKYWYIQRCLDILTYPTLFYEEPFDEVYKTVIIGLFIKLIILIIPLLSLVAVMAIFINFIQIGPLLTFEPLKPDLKKLNPIEKLKQLFKKRNLIEFLKSIIKTVFLGYLIYRVVLWAIDPLLKIPFAGLGAIFEILFPIMKIFAINVSIAYVIVAVADFFFQKSQHFTDLKMTKDEVKREFKEMEGDPLIKGERRQLHQELAMSDTVQSTKKASALITNPEHIAVAIFYAEGVVKLPVVTAKGKDHIAQMMIKVAQENNIPIMRDINLARALYEIPEYNYVPSDLVKPVATVLKWAKELYEGGRQNPL